MRLWGREGNVKIGFFGGRRKRIPCSIVLIQGFGQAVLGEQVPADGQLPVEHPDYAARINQDAHAAGLKPAMHIRQDRIRIGKGIKGVDGDDGAEAVFSKLYLFDALGQVFQVVVPGCLLFFQGPAVHDVVFVNVDDLGSGKLAGQGERIIARPGPDIGDDVSGFNLPLIGQIQDFLAQSLVKRIVLQEHIVFFGIVIPVHTASFLSHGIRLIEILRSNWRIIQSPPVAKPP